MGPITELQSVIPGIPIHIVGGTCTGLMGYVIMKVQIEGIPSYGEDQVFLVVVRGPFGSFPFMVVKIVTERYSTTLCKIIIRLNKVTTMVSGTGQ